MFLARILYPVEVLGPGKRIGLWFCGCPHRCKGCSNPELWEQQPQFAISEERLMELIGRITAENPVDGFTITGGDPFFQPEALNALLDRLRGISDDILVYTGYTLEELQALGESAQSALGKISVLIDGRYIEKLNNNCPLRGSENQRVIFLDENKRSAYEEYMKRGNSIQNFSAGNSVISVGIHRRGF